MLMLMGIRLLRHRLWCPRRRRLFPLLQRRKCLGLLLRRIRCMMMMSILRRRLRCCRGLIRLGGLRLYDGIISLVLVGNRVLHDRHTVMNTTRMVVVVVDIQAVVVTAVVEVTMAGVVTMRAAIEGDIRTEPDTRIEGDIRMAGIIRGTIEVEDMEIMMDIMKSSSHDGIGGVAMFELRVGVMRLLSYTEHVT
jgi:hypothetical protein